MAQDAQPRLARRQRGVFQYPLCSPSRAALHTSRMPHELGVDRNNLPVDPKVSLSGQVFRETGYAGLDHYEVRSYVGWHHHMTLSLLALWFLCVERLAMGERKRRR